MPPSICEKCENEDCYFSGTYVYHMDGIYNKCLSFKSKESQEKVKKFMEELKKKLKQAPLFFKLF